MPNLYRGIIGGAVAALLFFVGLGSVDGQDDFNQLQDPQFVNIHGSACQPANLGQATNFKATWNIQGVVNPNPLGSGKNFFVVCPIAAIDDGFSQPGADLYIHTIILDSSADDISCSAFRRDADNGGIIKIVSGTWSSATGSGGLTLEDLISDSDQSYTGFLESNVALCALPPQTGIGGLAIDSD